MPAAAASAFQLTAARRRLVHHNRLHPSQDDFNSQPREGGWGAVLSVCLCHAKFQLTAARRRLDAVHMLHNLQSLISTHSRAKAAGITILQRGGGQALSTHRRATASGQVVLLLLLPPPPRPTLFPCTTLFRAKTISTHSRAKAAGAKVFPNASVRLFQLTAARRRLGRTNRAHFWEICHFNSQLREGGWPNTSCRGGADCHFNSQPREGGWDYF